MLTLESNNPQMALYSFGFSRFDGTSNRRGFAQHCSCPFLAAWTLVLDALVAQLCGILEHLPFHLLTWTSILRGTDPVLSLTSTQPSPILTCTFSCHGPSFIQLSPPVALPHCHFYPFHGKPGLSCS